MKAIIEPAIVLEAENYEMKAKLNFILRSLDHLHDDLCDFCFRMRKEKVPNSFNVEADNLQYDVYGLLCLLNDTVKNFKVGNVEL